MSLSSLAAHRKDTARDLPAAGLQHRHFASIAALVRTLPDTHDRAGIAAHFAAALKFTNPNFDRDRFLAACLPQPGPASVPTIDTKDTRR